MHLAVLANAQNSFIRTIGDGLARMARACGATADVHGDGLNALTVPLTIDFASPRSALGSSGRLAKNRRLFDRFVEKVAGASVIVVVAHVPISFARGFLRNIEALRTRLPKVPIVNYAHYYLPTVDKWGHAVLRGIRADLTAQDLLSLRQGTFGMGRFDWYLVASVVSEIPVPRGSQPYSLIGVDIDDGSLYPDQNGELRALVDFAQTRKNYSQFRGMQIKALERTRTPYRVLEGKFTIPEIRELYRKTGILFLAHRESFGLPICEIQACGSLVFAPHEEWAGAHWIKDDLRTPGPGWLSPNFVIYDDDVEKLVEQIEVAKASFDPARVVRTFREFHPHLCHGDREALGVFLNKVEDGTIHSGSHLNYEHIGR